MTKRGAKSPAWEGCSFPSGVLLGTALKPTISLRIRRYELLGGGAYSLKSFDLVCVRSLKPFGYFS